MLFGRFRVFPRKTEHHGDIDPLLFRMRHLSDGVVKAGALAVTDFVCPTEEARLVFNPDFTVWMDTIKSGRYEDTNNIFVPPTQCDYHVKEWFDDTHQKLMEVVSVWMQRSKRFH